MIEALSALAVLIVAFFAWGRNQRRAGRAEQQQKAEKDGQKLVDQARAARADARKRNDAGGLRENDGFRRD